MKVSIHSVSFAKRCHQFRLVIVVSLLSQLLYADAANNFVMNKFHYGANEEIRIDLGVLTIDSTDNIIPASNIYIVSTEISGLLEGSPLLPLDPSGAPNVIQGMGGGGFFDETIGFTEPAGSIGAGSWFIVGDANQNGIFDNGIDSTLEYAFTVELVTTVDSLPGASIAAMKDSAGALSSEWRAGHDYLSTLWDYFDARELSIAAARGPAHVMLTYFNQNYIGIMFGTDPKGIAKDIMLDTAGHYAGIAADPPDPQFRQLSPLLARQFVDSYSHSPVVRKIASLATTLDTEKALLEAFLRSLERYQGAGLEGQGDWALVHARAIKTYADLLVSQLPKTNNAIDDLIVELNNDSSDLDGFFAGFQIIVDQVTASGFAHDQLIEFQNHGLSAIEIENLRLDVIAADFSAINKANIISDLLAIQTGNADYIAAMNALSADMDTIIFNLENDPLVADKFPIANAGGPYSGNEGGTINFDGTASSALEGDIVRYAWDFDADGEFDDGNRVAEAYDIDIGFDDITNFIVTLKVEDAAGRKAIAHAEVDVFNTNSPPVVTPPLLSPDAVVEIGSSQLYTMNTFDPDGDILTIDWYIDGILVGTGATFTYQPLFADVGVHRLSAVVSDNQTRGGTTVFSWTVQALEVDADLDGYTPTGGDCDNNNANVNPAVTEIVSNGIDDDCNPETADVDHPPVATLFTAPALGVKNEPVTFIDHSTDPNGLSNIVQWDWDFGDGNTSTDQNPEHTYIAGADYAVSLTVTDAQGNRDTRVQPLQVFAQSTTDRISIPNLSDQPMLGEEGNNQSNVHFNMSEDKRWIVFSSQASNLVVGDTNGSSDVFVHNRLNGQTTRISLHSDGSEAQGSSDRPAVSGDGRLIVFYSKSDNLVGNDTDGDGVCDRDCVTTAGSTAELFLRDRDVSGDGVYDEPGDVSTRHIDRQIGNDFSLGRETPSISADGRYVVSVTNFTPPGGSFAAHHVILNDLQTGTAEQIDRRLDGSPNFSAHANLSDGFAAPGSSFVSHNLSADGRYIVFLSRSPDLVGGDNNGDGRCDSDCVSGDLNNVFVYDRVTQTNKLISVNSLGDEAEEAFLALQGTGSHYPSISADGRFISFSSQAQNLEVDEFGQVIPDDAPNMLEVFLHDRDPDGNGIFDESGSILTERVSRSFDGTPLTASAIFTDVSDDGRFVSFRSRAENLVPGVTFTGTFNHGLFLYDRLTQTTTLVSQNSYGESANVNIFGPDVSGDASVIAYQTKSNNLIGTEINGFGGLCDQNGRFDLGCDTNQQGDIYIRDYDPDQDGVSSNADQCLNTQAGVPVNSAGCDLPTAVSISKTPVFQQLQSGGTAVFTISVLNNGEAPLSDITVADLQAADCDAQFATLAPGEQLSYDCEVPGVTADITNVASVSATSPAGTVLGNSASADVDVVHPAIVIELTPDTQTVPAGIDFLFHINVTNTGDVALNGVTVSDSLIPGCNRVIGDLEAGITVTYSCLGSGVTQSLTNSVTVVGLPPAGQDVSTSDDANVVVTAALDFMPPLLTLPASVTLEATSASGAVHSYSATATDNADPSPTVTCSPLSGSIFPLGITAIGCTATDLSANNSSGSFDITVVDTTPPTMVLPSDAVLDATDSNGIAHDFNVTAADLVTLFPEVTCLPTSGSLFPVGTTTVNCSATDDASNSSSGSFTVTVNAPPAASEPPPPVTDLFARAKSGKVDLIWTHVDASSYNIYRSDNGSPVQLIANTTSTYAAYADFGLSNGVEYCYIVYAVNDENVESVASNQVCAIPQALRLRRRR